MHTPLSSIRAYSVAAMLALGLVTPSNAGDLVVKESKRSVKETADALVAALDAKGIKVFARVDHGAGAAAAGLTLAPSEVVIFGNPKLGSPLMSASPTTGLDLPMKVLVFQDKDGKVKLGYLDPKELKDRHDIEGQDAIIAMMTKALDGLTSAAAGAP